MKMKKIISLLLLLTVLLTIPVHAHAEAACGITGCSCTSCSYTYTNYKPSNSNPSSTHTYNIKCTVCGVSDWIGFTDSHSFSGNRCTLCGYTKSCSHSSTSTSWSGCNYTEKCTSCGAVVSSGTSHSYSYGSWSYYSTSQHKRTGTCSKCGTTTTGYGNHSTTVKYESYDAEQHSRFSFCSGCNSTVGSVSYEDHKDTNGDDKCDLCEYLTTRFSVTVPTSMALTASNQGKVNAATNAAIENHSTAAVKLTGLRVSTKNGWKLVPFSYDLSGEKVDSRQIGFQIAECRTTTRGTQESLSISGVGSIPKDGTLPLSYSAVVTATSQPVNEQVLTVEFTVGWA